MKALSPWQPWASYIAAGMKRFETRSWGSPYRGELAIHASKRVLGLYERDLLAEYQLPFAIDEIPLGCIVATCRLADILPTTKALERMPPQFEREFNLGDFAPGRFAWELVDVVPLPEPVFVRGAQGLWEWTR